MKIQLSKQITFFFLSASIFISVLLAEAVVLTHFGQFRSPLVHLSLIPTFVIVMLFSISLKKDIRLLPQITPPVLLIILLISLILIFFPHDSFGGTDQAVYSNLAFRLASNSSFKIPSYFNNLPGNPAEYMQTWHQGYPIWLGTQISLFGIQWMLRSNIVIIILGLSSLFLVSSHMGGKTNGLITVLLFSSSMPFLWFSREMMSENLSFFLLWSIILFLLFHLKTKRFVYLLATFICSWLFGSTRFEGFLLQFVLLFTLPILLFLNKISFKKILVITIIFILILISNIYINNDIFIPTFLKNYVPQVAVSIKRDVSSLIPKNFSIYNIKYSVISGTSNESLFNRLPFFIFQMIAKYNFILVIFSIFLIAVQFLFRIKKLEKTKKFFFIILILLIPEYFKLTSPNVAYIQPWLYRRYVYALLPLGYLCLSLFFGQFKNKIVFVVLVSIFFVINVNLSNPILFLKNNWTLVDKIEEITKSISQKDIVLIDYRQPLGNYDVRMFLTIRRGIRNLLDWQLANSEFFPESKTFYGTPYDKIFLLSAFINYPNYFPSFKIVKIKELDVDYSQLIFSCQLNLLMKEEGATDTYNYKMISFPSAVKYCSQPKNEIAKHKEKIYLFELVYKNEES